MRNKANGKVDDYCVYYSVPCGEITHCTVDYERCCSQPAYQGSQVATSFSLAAEFIDHEVDGID